MERRLIAVSFLLALFLGIVSVEILLIGAGLKSVNASGLENTKTVVLDDARGVIYDCAGLPLTGETEEYKAVIFPSENAVKSAEKVLLPENFESAKEKLSKGKIAVAAAKIASYEDVPIYKIKKRYSENQLAAHVIGYIQNDSENGVYGIEKSYNEWLKTENSKLKVTFYVDGLGRIMPGEKPRVSYDEYNVKKGVRLTLDKSIQRIAENALDSSAIKKGAVVVIEVKTGKIRAMASRPSFSPINPEKSLNSDDAPFVNRAITPFAVGSVFKPVVAAAALENGVSQDFKFTCAGSIQREGNVFHCHETEGHGEVDMNGAIAVSCNPYFINLSSYIKPENVLEKAALLGLGAENILAPAIKDSSGTLPSEDSLKSPASFANFSFGQGNFTATPLQIAAVYSAIANDGVYIKPSLVEGKVNADGSFSGENPPRKGVVSMEKQTAEKLQFFLENAVTNGSGRKASPERVRAAGKTATAQSGSYKNGKEVLHTSFAGYFPAENPIYAVMVFNEEGSSGAVDCAPVFKEIADKLF